MLEENEEKDIIVEAETLVEANKKIQEHFAETIAWVLGCKSSTFPEFEEALIPKLYTLGKLFILLFLNLREEHYKATHPTAEKNYKYQGPKPRVLGCFVGKLRYWRRYLYDQKYGGGYYPLDKELGLMRDGFSLMVQSYATRIATKVSYAQTVAILSLFMRWSPAKKTIERTVLGFGRHTGDWFESALAPENDGEVLIIQIDGKASPTATEEELEKRRGKRKVNPHPGSQRHRGRAKRARLVKKPRRKKGDKSKNGKAATIVVMYTLKRASDGKLEGPINKWVYASNSPKRHAFAIACREATKRGFVSGDGKLVQLVTDGDNDLATYKEEYFPHAIHTIDIFHVMEYIWEAGGCLYKEGSDELVEWVEAQKDLLYKGHAKKIVEELDRRIGLLPQKGPGMKKRRERLTKVRNYLQKRLSMMDYKSLRQQDLEISSGAVEGAVKYVIAKRFDCGGMRWIKERSEALLQLRCIEINDDWDKFISFIHDKTRLKAEQSERIPVLKSNEPAPLPVYGCI